MHYELFVAVPCVIMCLLVFYCVQFQDACYPRMLTNATITCVPGTAGKVQTISEVTARSDLTAELFAGLAGISLIGIYATIISIMESFRMHGGIITPVMRAIINASFAVGALGFVGLTVWNLRVSEVVHICFTAQTIVAVGIQITSLRALQKSHRTEGAASIAVNAVYGLFVTSGLWYVGFITYRHFEMEMPAETTPEYFEFKYYWHAVGQYTFFVTYYVMLGLINSAVHHDDATGIKPTVPPYDANKYAEVPTTQPGVRLRRDLQL